MAKKKERNTRTIKCRGYKPDAHQRAVHLLLNQKGKGHIVVVKSKRQVGKSLMIENELLRYACTWSGTTSICVSPTLTQARKIFKEIDAALSNSGIVKNSNATLLEMSFINGSRIFFKSAEQKENLRGYTVSGILCIDEAAYISDDVFYTVLPWTDVKHANILICSTPRTRQGFFYDYFQRGLDEAEMVFSQLIGTVLTLHVSSVMKGLNSTAKSSLQISSNQNTLVNGLMPTEVYS